jgi:hypothetical protein
VADINTRIEQFVQLRDKIKKLDDEHKEKMKPYRDTLETLNGVLLQHLNSIGVESVRAEAGTVYETVKKSASIADKSALWAFVVATGDWDLLDYKANVTAVADFIEKNSTPPPGVNYTTTKVAGVRRS